MYKKYSEGMIEIITGPMFSGKSEELIKRIRQLGYAGIESLVFKPSIDNRWSTQEIVSRGGSSTTSLAVENSKQILDTWTNSKERYTVVAIDEAQFFDEDLYYVVKRMADEGVRVIVSGLDTNYLGEPFGVMPKLMAIAEIIDKQTAVCVCCGSAATMTFKKINNDSEIVIGSDEYEARCRKCHRQGMLEKAEQK